MRIHLRLPPFFLLAERSRQPGFLFCHNLSDGRLNLRLAGGLGRPKGLLKLRAHSLCTGRAGWKAMQGF